MKLPEIHKDGKQMSDGWGWGGREWGMTAYWVFTFRAMGMFKNWVEVMVSLYCKNTKCHRIVHFNMVSC